MKAHRPLATAVLISLATLSLPLGAQNIDCPSFLMKPEIDQAFPNRATPSQDELRTASRLYAISPAMAKCVYPEVRRESLTGDIGHPGLGLRDQSRYVWGKLTLVQAVVAAPEGYRVSTQTLQSGDIVLEAEPSRN